MAEIGDFRRFTNPRELMAWLGLVPREHSSGATAVRDARWQPVGPGALYKYASGAPAAGLGDRSFAATGRCPRRSRM